MGNFRYGTTYMREEGDDRELRPKLSSLNWEHPENQGQNLASSSATHLETPSKREKESGLEFRYTSAKPFREGEQHRFRVKGVD